MYKKQKHWLTDNMQLQCTLFFSFRPNTQHHPSFNKDVILLPHSAWDEVIKHKTKRKFHENGLILSAFEIRKMWDNRTVFAEIQEAFQNKIPDDVRYYII